MCDLKEGETHPACRIAMNIINEKSSGKNAFILLESMSSCAIEGNRLAEICSKTLERIIKKQPVGERYLMGLALFISQMDKDK